jgi:hypothetical protein
MPPNICRPIYKRRGAQPVYLSLLLLLYNVLILIRQKFLFFFLDAQRCWALAILSHVISLFVVTFPHISEEIWENWLLTAIYIRLLTLRHCMQPERFIPNRIRSGVKKKIKKKRQSKRRRHHFNLFVFSSLVITDLRVFYQAEPWTAIAMLFLYSYN